MDNALVYLQLHCEFLSCIHVTCTLSGKGLNRYWKESVGRECAIELHMDDTSACWARRVGGGLD